MGLDVAELLYEAEDHFGITLQDSELESIYTVGNFAALIQSRIQAAHNATCPTLSGFLKVRSCVRKVRHDDELQIRPYTRIVDVLSKSERKQLWRELQNLLGMILPSLQLPPSIRRLVVFCILMALVSSVTLAIAVDFRTLPLALFMTVILAFILNICTNPFRFVPPEKLTTFGDVTRFAVSTMIATKQLHLRTIDEIVNELRPIIVSQLGVDPSEVVPDASFSTDLGLS